MKKLSLSRFAGAFLLIVSVSLILTGSVQASARMPEFVLKSVVNGADVDSRSFSGKVFFHRAEVASGDRISDQENSGKILFIGVRDPNIDPLNTFTNAPLD